jgi:glycosyltransferase involved in cell wall biosynthesis
VAVQPTRAIALDEFIGRPSRTRTILNGAPGLGDGSIENTRDAKRRELGLSSNDFLVLGVGRLVEQKEPFEFLRIARELHRRVPSARFLWLGDGELAHQWNTAIAQHGLAHVVSCTGWCSDITPYLLAGDLVLHIARFEGFPLALIEAMSAGLPCAVNRDLLREIPMLGSDTVLRADDIDRLAEELQNPARLALVARSARKLYDDALSAARMAQAYEGLYADTIYRARVHGELNTNAVHVRF